MAYLLAVNRSHINKLPKDATPGQWSRYNDAFQNVELTSAEIAAEIRAGYAIAAQHDGRRKAANWRLAQHIGVDLDNGALSWDELVEMPLVRDHAKIVHTTASHRPDNPRYRVLFLLDRPIRDAAEYRRAVAVMLQAFGTADEHCRDASRLFFGAAGCSLLLMPDNVLTAADIAGLAANLPRSDPPSLPPFVNGGGSSSSVPPPIGGDIVPPSEISAARLEAHSEALLDKIRTCPDGTKWATLRDVSYLFGGYVATGYYERADIEARLRQAIETRRSTVASMAAAYKTITNGLDNGEAKPAWYERKERATPPARSPASTLRDRIAAARSRVTRDRIAAIEAEILAADDNDESFTDLAVEYSRLKEFARHE